LRCPSSNGVPRADSSATVASSSRRSGSDNLRRGKTIPATNLSLALENSVYQNGRQVLSNSSKHEWSYWIRLQIYIIDSKKSWILMSGTLTFHCHWFLYTDSFWKIGMRPCDLCNNKTLEKVKSLTMWSRSNSSKPVEKMSKQRYCNGCSQKVELSNTEVHGHC
jgi:hypothetical protein